MELLAKKGEKSDSVSEAAREHELSYFGTTQNA